MYKTVAGFLLLGFRICLFPFCWPLLDGLAILSLYCRTIRVRATVANMPALPELFGLRNATVVTHVGGGRPLVFSLGLLSLLSLCWICCGSPLSQRRRSGYGECCPDGWST